MRPPPQAVAPAPSPRATVPRLFDLPELHLLTQPFVGRCLLDQLASSATDETLLFVAEVESPGSNIDTIGIRAILRDTIDARAGLRRAPRDLAELVIEGRLELALDEAEGEAIETLQLQLELRRTGTNPEVVCSASGMLTRFASDLPAPPDTLPESGDPR